jgi:hypothetical protein
MNPLWFNWVSKECVCECVKKEKGKFFKFIKISFSHNINLITQHVTMLLHASNKGHFQALSVNEFAFHVMKK